MALWCDETFEGGVRYGLEVTRTVYSARSDFQQIDIFDTRMWGRTLTLDGVYMTSMGDEYRYHELLVHPSMTTARGIERVLVVGGGDGGTTREVLRYPEVREVVLAEIDGQVIDACRAHMPELGAWDDPRLTVRVGDGIEYVRQAADDSFDVILVDSTDPVGAGEVLFSVAFYEQCRRVLRPGGVLAAQTESPALLPREFAAAVGRLGQVFPRVHPYFGSVPIYGAGPWSWTYAGEKDVDPLRQVEARVARVEAAARHYNRHVHRGAFAVPNDVLAALGGKIQPLPVA